MKGWDVKGLASRANSICRIAKYVGTSQKTGKLITVRAYIGNSPHGTGIYLYDTKCPFKTLDLVFDYGTDQFRQVSAIYDEKDIKNTIGKYVICTCTGHLMKNRIDTMLVKHIDIEIKESSE